MQFKDARFRISGNSPAAQPPGFLAKLLTLVTGTVLLVVGLMFSLVVFAVAAVVASAVLAYLWWKTRDLRRQIRENPRGARVIDGEAVRDD